MDEAAANESDTSDDEAMEIAGKTDSSDVCMETDNNDGEKDGVTEEAATTKTKEPMAPKPDAVASGLPQSIKGLESLIDAIHQTVNDSVLPRLHRCLTAKVHIEHTADT